MVNHSCSVENVLDSTVRSRVNANQAVLDGRLYDLDIPIMPVTGICSRPVRQGAMALPMCQNTGSTSGIRRKMPTMKFNLRESMPILNSDTPAATKIAALIFLICYCVFLRLFVGVISAAHLLSVRNFSISPKVPAGTLKSVMLGTVAVFGIWAVVKGLLIAKLFFRRRWAKNVLCVITLLTAFALLLMYSVHPANASLYLRNNLEHVAEVVAVILLFTPGSRSWFRLRA
jgi:hypothetical protein